MDKINHLAFLRKHYSHLIKLFFTSAQSGRQFHELKELREQIESVRKEIEELKKELNIKKG